MSELWNDVRYSFRLLARSPGFTAVAVASLALGIGATTSIFTIVNAVLLRPLAVASPEALVEVYFSESDGYPYSTWSYPDYADARDQSRAFTGLVAQNLTALSYNAGNGQSEFLLAETVTGNYFPTLGIAAERGRTLLPGDDVLNADPVAVVSRDFWQKRLGGDPAVIGRTLQLNGQKFTVVGIITRSFKGTIRGFSTHIWLPMLSQGRLRAEGGEDFKSRGRRRYFVKGRLAPGVTLDQAQSQLSTIAERLAKEYPETNKERKVSLLPSTAVSLHPLIDKALFPVATLLMSVVVLVLLIACSNVAGLMLVRASGRRKEIAVRLAMGAARGALVRQLLTEALLVSLLAGGVGLLVAYWTTNLLLSFKPPIPVPVSLDLGIDGRVLGFTIFISIVTGAVFGIAPALQASRPDLVPTLKDEVVRWGRTYRPVGLRNALVVAQVAISLLLLVDAGLFVRSLLNAQSIEPGFSTRNAVVVMLDASLPGYTVAKTKTYFSGLVDRLSGLPGVEAVALSDSLPLGTGFSTRAVYMEGRPPVERDKEPEVDMAEVGPGYFAAMGIPVVSGREFTGEDREGAPEVAVVNEAMAREFWPSEDALGKRISFKSAQGPFAEIVGVARNGKYRTLGEDPRPYVYSSLLQGRETTVQVIIKTATRPELMLETVRREVLAHDPGVPLIELKTMNQHLSIMLFPPRMAALLLTVLGGLALLLATTGLYAVIAYSVAQRTREVGIRMALGAGRRDVLRLMLGQGMALVGVGMTLGLVAAFGVSRVLASFLIGMSGIDPVTFIGIPTALGVVALAASFIPARRATRVDPWIALRYE